MRVLYNGKFSSFVPKKEYTKGMAERIVKTLEERSPEGQKIYETSMELSAGDKERIRPFINSDGDILDLGAGAGPITQRLRIWFPDSHVVALDQSGYMIKRLSQRFAGDPNVEVVQADAREFRRPKPFSTIVAISFFHEVFSGSNYNHEAVIETIKNAESMLEKEGRLIIRDGVQPEHEELYLRPITQFAVDRFQKFVAGFGKVRPVNYTIGNFHSDVFVQRGRAFQSDDVGKSLIEISSQSASEMFSKYFYAEENLPVELSEQFGIWTLREYQKILLECGFAIVHAETYALPWLIENHYSKDWEVFHLKDGVLSNAPYPPSTMLLVGEKQ